MPQIREYVSETSGLRPSATGVDATAAAARRVQGAYNEGAQSLKAAGESVTSAGRSIANAGQTTAQMGANIGSTVSQLGQVVDKAVEHQEVSRGSKSLAELQADATTQWNERIKTADPNDPTTGPNFLKELDERLEQFGTGFLSDGGQRWAQQQTLSMRDHFTRKVAADQSAMAGQAVAVNLEQTKNALSLTAKGDPTAIDESLRMYQSTVDHLIATSPNLSAAQAAKMRGDLTQDGKATIVRAGMIGLAEMNPAAAKKAIESGRYKDFISADDAKAILGNVRQQERADRVDANYRKMLEREQRQAISDAAENDYLKRMFGGDEAARASITAKGIVNDDRLDNTAKRRWLATVERENEPEPFAKVSATNSGGMLERIRSGEITSVEPIYQGYQKGDFTKSDFNFLIKQYNELQTPDGQKLNRTRAEFFKAIGPQIDKSALGLPDPGGKEARFRFEQDVVQKIDEYRKAGKNPYDLFDPAKPDYMGSPAAVAPYQRSMTQQMEDRMRALRRPAAAPVAAPGVEPPPPPERPQRKPNESAADYLRRVGMQ